MSNYQKEKINTAFYTHKPVMVNEAIHYLNIQNDKIYVDCTLGLGGHSFEIIKHLGNNGKLIGLEHDKTAFEIAKNKLSQFSNCYLFHANFVDLKEVLQNLHINMISGGIILDLGTNSMQLDDPMRGFSFRNNGPLDMRMDNSQTLTADTVINKYNEHKLADIIYRYGEERFARKIAKKIVETRQKTGSIKETSELANLILSCYPKNKYFKIHPATKTFQAIRIEVNNELANLDKVLCFTEELLLPESRLTVISFHSLEDRIIKNFLKSSKKFKILTKKPIVPSQNEIKLNPRSRSAKLRAAEKKD